MFKISKLYEQKKEKFYSYCRKEFIDLYNKGKKLSEENFPKRMNSYENNLLMILWDDKLLLKRIKYYIEQAGNEFYETNMYNLDSCYNEAIKHKLIFMLIERFEELLNKEKTDILKKFKKRKNKLIKKNYINYE